LFIVALSLSFTNVFGVEEADVESFKAAYAAYQEHQSAGRDADAVQSAETAYTLGQKIYGQEHKNTAALAYNYGQALLKVNNHEAAGEILSETLALYRTNYGDDALELVDPLMALGRVNTVDRELRIKHLNQALKIVGDKESTDSLLYAMISLEAGEVLFLLGDTSAGDNLENAYNYFSKTEGMEHPRTAHAAFLLGKHEFFYKKYKLAKKYFLECLNVFDKPGMPDNQIGVTAHAFLGIIHENLGESEESTEHLLAIGRMTLADLNQEYIPINKVQPIYPRRALRNRDEGVVTVEFNVDELGRVVDPKVVESEGHEDFKDAALKTAKKFRYVPRFVDGKPVKTEGIQTTITFAIGK
jgi:TonB family protein